MSSALPQPDPPWDIRRDGRAWTHEAIDRAMLAPQVELIDGKLVWDDQEGVTLLGLLLENLGIDAAVRLGDPAVWREALDELEYGSATG